LRTKLSNLDRQAEAIILSQKLLKKSVSSAHIFRMLSPPGKDYTKLWDVVRRARRRANRKYKIFLTYESLIPREFLAHWIIEGVLPIEHFEKILFLLIEYRNTCFA